MNRWICLHVTVPSDQAEAALEALWELDTIGVEEQPDPPALRLKAYFDPAVTSDLRAGWRQAVRRHEITELDLELYRIETDPEEWVRQCKATFRAFPVGESFFIHPPWEAPSREHRINLLLEPGHAFGTGSHASTQLCLLVLEERAARAASILDLGTGSGILAMAARKLNSAAWIAALDNDEEALEVARENSLRNGASGIAWAVGGPEVLRSTFELVVANLTLEIFRRIRSDLLPLVGRRVVLSGFTSDQLESVRALFAELHFSDSWELNGWACCELRRRRQGLRGS